jgi:hypothetical protein
MPIPAIFPKNHSLGFCPRKTPVEKHPHPDGTRPKNFHMKNSSGIYPAMVAQEKASGNHGARGNADKTAMEGKP